MPQDGTKYLRIAGARLAASGVSDPGRQRQANEDSIFLNEEGACVLLADGMGGHERGGEASRTAIEVISRYLTPESMTEEMADITDGAGVPAEVASMLSLVDSAVRRANDELYERNRREGLKRFMGTTITGLVVVPSGYVLWFHVGDSRIYRWRDDRLHRLTADHSVHADWERAGRVGDEPKKNVITRAIGPSAAVSPEVAWEAVQPDDLYLLCSDGLSDMIDESQIRDIFRSETDVDVIAQRLVDAANAAGGKDNVSAVVCRT